MGLTPGENIYKLVSYMVRDSTREARLTCRCGSHRTKSIPRLPSLGEGFVLLENYLYFFLALLKESVLRLRFSARSAEIAIVLTMHGRDFWQF